MKGLAWLAVLIAAVLLAGVALLTQTRASLPALDTAELNRVLRVIEDDWPDAQSGHLPDSPLSYTFVPEGQSLHDHILARDTIVTVTIEGQTVGSLVIHNHFSDEIQTVQRRQAAIFTALVVIIAATCAAFARHQYTTIIAPFRRLEAFAAKVAQGDLDVPLAMDRHNRFGAFTESFDLMRDQLAIARKNEQLADASKKELIASLSHDIKNPVGAILVMGELAEAKYGPTPETTAILAKAGQIDLLISNLFTATLEDLQRLQVNLEEVTSTDLASAIKEADYQNLVQPFTLPDCVVTVDRLRFRQIIDNLIGNSYKYAGTPIEVGSLFADAHFHLSIHDHGPGVPGIEPALLCEKYYRAPNAEGKPGAGLGLYLSRYFLQEMGGDLTLTSDDGLCVTLHLKM